LAIFVTVQLAILIIDYVHCIQEHFSLENLYWQTYAYEKSHHYDTALML